jgi:hypothetical protein
VTDAKQRAQWTEHMKDEATELQAQQVSAGEDHAPVGRPLPYSANDLDGAVAAAVQAEREACAAVAEAWASGATVQSAFADVSPAQVRLAQDVAGAIAQAIRQRQRRRG